VYFVALAPLHETGDLVSAIASAVGFRFYGGADPEQQLLSYFRDKRLLLVLDNFEHLLARAELGATLLGHAPQIKLLVTSREALKLQEEWLRPVEGMSFPAQGQAADPDSYSAVQLFVQRARQVRGDFSLAAEGAQVARICRLVAGMPLAVELAAAWVGLLSCAEIAAEIERSLDFLAASARNLPDRHRSIRAVFESTWERLDPAEQAELARLALFRGPFDRARRTPWPGRRCRSCWP
jgi:predicted ATPase